MPRPPESAEERIDQLSHVEAFPPPSGFAARAQARDPAEYAHAAGDGPGWWAEQAKPGPTTRPLPGVSAALFEEEGREIDQGRGLLVLTQPWPSMLRTLYGDPGRFVQTY